MEFFNIDVAALITESDRLANAAEVAESTRRNYASDWKGFTSWCLRAARDPLPAECETVLAYLADMLQHGRKVTTIERHAAGIKHYHRQAGLPLSEDYRVNALIQGVRRLRGELPTQKTPLVLETLRRLCASPAAGDVEIRDRSVLTLGFGSAMRRSNLAGLDLVDVAIVPKGLLVTLKREKQNQKGQPRVVAIPRGIHPQTCAVVALQAWLAIRGQRAGPLYIRTYNGRIGALQRRLSPRVITAIVKRAIALAGLDPHTYASHSMRRGFVTTAFEAGVGEILIAATTGHRSLSSLRMYFRSSDPFKAAASGMIGL